MALIGPDYTFQTTVETNGSLDTPSAVLRYSRQGSTVHTWTLDPSLVVRATTTGSPSGMLVSRDG